MKNAFLRTIVCVAVIVAMMAPLSLTPGSSMGIDRDFSMEELIIPIDVSTSISFDDVIDFKDVDEMEMIETIKNSDSDSILLMDSSTLTDIKADNSNVMKEAIVNGSMVIVSGDSYELQSIGTSVIVNPNAVVSSVYHDPVHNVTYCYGIELCDYEASSSEINDELMTWVNSVRSNSTALRLNTNYNNVVVYNETLMCGAGGKINATGIYSLLGTSNGSAYYSVKYSMESITSISSWGTADMTVECDVDERNSFQHLIDYGPDSTVGTTSTAVGVSMSIGLDGVSFGSSISWSYTVPNVIIHNQCDTSEDYFKIWHDTDEDSADATTRVQPGAIVSVNVGSQYQSYDKYIVNYEKPYENHLWPWDPTTELKQYTLTAAAVLVPA